MALRMTFLHMDRTEALEDFAKKKILTKIERQAQSLVDAQLTLAVEQKKHKARLVFKDKVGEKIVIERVHEDMYSAINKMAASLDRAMVKRKGKLLNRRFDKSGVVDNELEDVLDEASFA